MCGCSSIAASTRSLLGNIFGWASNARFALAYQRSWTLAQWRLPLLRLSRLSAVGIAILCAMWCPEQILAFWAFWPNRELLFGQPLSCSSHSCFMHSSIILHSHALAQCLCGNLTVMSTFATVLNLDRNSVYQLPSIATPTLPGTLLQPCRMLTTTVTALQLYNMFTNNVTAPQH